MLLHDPLGVYPVPVTDYSYGSWLRWNLLTIAVTELGPFCIHFETSLLPIVTRLVLLIAFALGAKLALKPPKAALKRAVKRCERLALLNGPKSLELNLTQKNPRKKVMGNPGNQLQSNLESSFLVWRPLGTNPPLQNREKRVSESKTPHFPPPQKRAFQVPTPTSIMEIFWLETPFSGVGGNRGFRLRNPLFPRKKETMICERTFSQRSPKGKQNETHVFFFSIVAFSSSARRGLGRRRTQDEKEDKQGQEPQQQEQSNEIHAKKEENNEK